MQFVDECLFRVEAGAGGDGAIAFRREKYVPYGGPSGGDGGRGGSVYLVADPGLGTLYDFHRQPVYRAGRGENGQGKDCYGAGGHDLELRVPLGTQVIDVRREQLVAELITEGQRLCVARGGTGGRGNIHFATPSDRAPRKAERGRPGQVRELRLELKVIADVGLLGFPNVGKSTFVRSVSRATPKVANYPFTTLRPHLGVVVFGGDAGGSFVVADIPGLIAGASEGVGLGLQFLRHVERTRVLLHLVTLTDEPDRSPLDDYRTVRRELENYNAELLTRTEIVVLSQADRTEVSEAYPELKAQFQAELGVELKLLSAVSRQGLAALLEELRVRVAAIPREPLLIDRRSEPLAALVDEEDEPVEGDAFIEASEDSGQDTTDEPAEG
jgi:GTPase